ESPVAAPTPADPGHDGDAGAGRLPPGFG
ncbi:sodium:proton antiporter, partial [Clavibacter michiganensis subsp. michiganensis]|nr:sodium:proton antiporter [Clavibacter michiganensis subsp. michiganensis]